MSAEANFVILYSCLRIIIVRIKVQNSKCKCYELYSYLGEKYGIFDARLPMAQRSPKQSIHKYSNLKNPPQSVTKEILTAVRASCGITLRILYTLTNPTSISRRSWITFRYYLNYLWCVKKTKTLNGV